MTFCRTVVMLFVCGVGCTLNNKRVPSSLSGSPVVRNGTVVEEAKVQLGQATTIVVPENSIVQRGDVGNLVLVRIEKTLGYMGHPPQSVDFEVLGQAAQCVYRVDGVRMFFSTIGEFSSPEGGMVINLTFQVPAQVNVERSSHMSGSESMAAKWKGTVSDTGLREGVSSRSVEWRSLK